MSEPGLRLCCGPSRLSGGTAVLEGRSALMPAHAMLLHPPPKLFKPCFSTIKSYRPLLSLALGFMCVCVWCVCCVLLCLCLSMWMCVPKTWVSSLKSYLVPLSFLWPIDQTHCYAMSPTLQWACLTSVYNCWCWCWIVAQCACLASVYNC